MLPRTRFEYKTRQAFRRLNTTPQLTAGEGTRQGHALSLRTGNGAGHLSCMLQRSMSDVRNIISGWLLQPQETLEEGAKKVDSIVESLNDVGLKDRSMIWNTDLLEVRPHPFVEPWGR